MKKYFSLKDFKVKDKTVLLRADFNVPMSGKRIADNTRIKAAIPTIKFLTKRGAKVIIISHFGRPDGKKEKTYSLRPIAI